MMETSEFVISVSYSQLAVFDHSLERPFNEWTDRHVAQGFAWRPGSVSFCTVEESAQYFVMVRLGDHERDPEPDAIRVIDVPFDVPHEGRIEIGSISDSVPLVLPSGSYQLRFECHRRTNDSGPTVYLSFVRDDNPQFQVIRTDLRLDPDADLLLSASPA
jgi:Competence protein J (ComJ)